MGEEGDKRKFKDQMITLQVAAGEDRWFVICVKVKRQMYSIGVTRNLALHAMYAMSGCQKSRVDIIWCWFGHGQSNCYGYTCILMVTGRVSSIFILNVTEMKKIEVLTCYSCKISSRFEPMWISCIIGFCSTCWYYGQSNLRISMGLSGLVIYHTRIAGLRRNWPETLVLEI